MGSRGWFEKALDLMEDAHGNFAKRLPAPVRIPREDGYVYRFGEQSGQQAILLKLARIITGLRAAHLLIDNGFLQEASTIQRTVDEAQEDTIFLVYGYLAKKWTPLHEKFLERFWGDDPLSKGNIARPRIRDYIANVEAEFDIAPAGMVLAPIQKIYSVYSGYTHSNAPHVMELFDGKWLLKGSSGTQFQIDQARDMRNQYFRGMLAHAFAALEFDDAVRFKRLQAFSNKFLKATEFDDVGFTPASPP